jgi:sporulation protein YlmC with PRC-barrel domain
MSGKEEYIPCQALTGKQVVDIRGVLVGKVNDVAFNLQKPDIILKVMMKNNEITEIVSSDIQSAKDIILLKKEVKVLKESKPSHTTPPLPPQAPVSPKTEASLTPRSPKAVAPSKPKVPSSTIICQNCGAKAPSRAKFCPKCGQNLR